MTNTSKSVRSEPAHTAAHLPRTAGRGTALALLLLIAVGVWQAQRLKASHAATAPVAAAQDPRQSNAATTATARNAEWERFTRSIQQPAPQAPGSDLPAYEVLLGITSEPDATGTLVVKRLVLDLGDLSTHTVDLPTP